jgi:hypothetical protein
VERSEWTPFLFRAMASKLERFWSTDKVEQVNTLKRLNFSLTTALSNSVYGNAARKEHILNLKRSLKTFQLMQHNGLRSVPHVYFCTRRDIERWAEWSQKNP